MANSPLFHGLLEDLVAAPLFWEAPLPLFSFFGLRGGAGRPVSTFPLQRVLVARCVVRFDAQLQLETCSTGPYTHVYLTDQAPKRTTARDIGVALQRTFHGGIGQSREEAT